VWRFNIKASAGSTPIRAAAHFYVMPEQTKGDPMLPERQKQKYEEFFESTANNGILDTNTTVMIQLAASFSIGCYP